jgi:hypothetical protein
MCRPSFIATAATLSLAAAARGQSGPGLDLTWNTIDCGGTVSSAGTLQLFGVIGQPDAGRASQGPLECLGGFLGAPAAAACYVNCDGSTTAPVLNVNDFVCFQTRFAAADPYADCDHSASLNVNDFVCFQQRFAAGCP